MKANDRLHLIEGLRAVANFYEKNPTAYYDGMHVVLNMYVWGGSARQVLAETATLFGAATKICDDRNVTVSRSFSDRVTLAVFAPRNKLGPLRDQPHQDFPHIPA